jgi:hypothetical protein
MSEEATVEGTLRHPELQELYSEHWGYSDYTEFPSGGEACIHKFAFTYAILSELSNCGYGDRWCFCDYATAKRALMAWSGEDDTEPEGWHRHPSTGRRRPNGDKAQEYINF